MLHGGPGSDHSGFKPAFSVLQDVAQVIYYDHRGNGRSGGNDPSTWTLAQWGDDVKGLCDALGLVKPIVCGLSFGGFVAQSYATRYPDHPGKLVLLSTAARIDFGAVFRAFGRLGDAEVQKVAEDYWSHPTAEGRARYIAKCVPFYRQRKGVAEGFPRVLMRPATALHFNGPANEHGRMDFSQFLPRIECPVLVMAGEDDPIVPIELGAAMVGCLPPGLVQFERLASCGHDIHGDAPDRVFTVMRDFILHGISPPSPRA